MSRANPAPRVKMGIRAARCKLQRSHIFALICVNWAGVRAGSANIRRGDRVIVKTRDGEVMAKELVRQSAKKGELMSFTKPPRSSVLDAENIAWMARIVWPKQ